MTQAHPDRAELVALTSLRGIAAVFVMAHHFIFVLMEEVGRALPSHLFLKSYLWVDLFFLLSGFVLAYVYQSQFSQAVSRRDYSLFMRARFARVYPLHLFMLALFVALEVVQWLLLKAEVAAASRLVPPFTGGETPFTLVSNVLMLQTFHWTAYWNQPAWSIGAEWLIYFAVPWLIYAFYRAGIALQLVAVALAFLALGGIEYHFGDLGLQFAGWPMLPRCLGEAVLGMIAYNCYRRGYFLRVASAACVLPLLLLNILLLALPIPAVCSVVGFFWLVLSAARVPAGSGQWLAAAPLMYLGKISFAVYMLHWFVLELLRVTSLFFSGKPLPQNLNLVQEFAVCVAASVLVLLLAPLLYRFIEVPWRKRLAG